VFFNEFSDYITLTNNKTNESIQLDQKRVKIRENHNGLMAVSYVSPVFEAMDIEKFFGNFLTSEELSIDICGTGDFPVRFRGIVEGRGKELPENLDHRIILLQWPTSLDPRENVQVTGFSKFKPRGKIGD